MGSRHSRKSTASNLFTGFEPMNGKMSCSKRVMTAPAVLVAPSFLTAIPPFPCNRLERICTSSLLCLSHAAWIDAERNLSPNGFPPSPGVLQADLRIHADGEHLLSASKKYFILHQRAPLGCTSRYSP